MVVTRTDFRCTAPNSDHFVPISGKQPYLSQMADSQKNKGTFLSRTLKVVEKNVHSEIRFFHYWLMYGRFKYLPFKIRKQYLFEFQEHFLGIFGAWINGVECYLHVNGVDKVKNILLHLHVKNKNRQIFSIFKNIHKNLKTKTASQHRCSIYEGKKIGKFGCSPSQNVKIVPGIRASTVF